MRITQQRITIISVRKPEHRTLNDELQWIGSSLGLFNLRDKDQSCFRIFIELFKATRQGVALSSDEIAHRLHLTRGTVVHHLNKLMESGIVVHHANTYLLRDARLSDLITEIQRDLNRTCDSLKELAHEIDKSMVQRRSNTPE